MQKLINSLIFIAFISLAACSEKSFTTSSATPPPTDQQKNTGSACFTDRLCIGTVFMNTLDDFTKNYNYPSPESLGGSLKNQYWPPQYTLNITADQQEQPVSQHFKLKDYTGYKNGSKRFRHAIVTRNLVKHIQSVRNGLGQPVVITSGYRSPGYNSSLNGAATFSRHMYGDAVDIVSRHASATRLKQLCDAQGAYFSLAYQDGHAHCDWRNERMDSAFYPSPIQPENSEQIDPYLITGGRIQVEDQGEYFSLSLADFMPLDDHEGTPLHDWIVVLPTSEVLKSENKNITLKKNSGQYDVQLLVGAAVYFEKTIKW